MVVAAELGTKYLEVPKIDDEGLESLKAASRDNIRSFVYAASLAGNPEQVVVDVGCGYRTSEPEATAMWNREFKPYVAFDHTSEFDHQPQPGSAPNLVADAEQMPLPTAVADTVICAEVLEHTPNPEAVIQEITRILKLKGKLILTLPGKDVPLHEKLPHQHDYRRFDPEKMVALLKENGFLVLVAERKYFAEREINLLISAIKVRNV
jgi:SAM-dependent methyltransferase